MKRSLLAVGMVAAMLLAASSAFAAGLNLAWNNCLADGGTSNLTSACSSNLGQAGSLIGSFFSPADVVDVSGAEIVVDLISQTGVLPAWWQFKNVGSCRINSLSIAAFDGASCFDWAAGQASMNIAAYQLDKVVVGSARVLSVNAVPATAYGTLDQVNEFTAFRLNINNASTTTCAGCTEPVCIVFNSCNMTTPVPANNVRITGAANGVGSNIVTWQGPGANCAAMPARNWTWGQVKSLYR